MRASRLKRETSEHAAAHLIELDGFEERAEVAFAEAFVALPLDDLVEDRADDVLREDLQQHPVALLGIAVDQDAPLLELFELLLMPRYARRDAFVVSIWRILKSHAVRPQRINGAVDIGG